MKTKHITIPQPCSQSWTAMQATDQGRFCSHCQKTVIDFTGYDDEDFIAYFQQAKETPCGRLTQRQLAIEIPVAQKPLLFRPVKIYKYIAAGLFSIVGVPAAIQARQQETISINTTEQGEPELQDSTLAIGTDTVEIRGRVVDENGEAFAGASVSLLSAQLNVITDFEGNFSLKATQTQRRNDTLLFRALGHEEQKINLASYHDNTITVMEPVFLGGLQIYTKPSLWYRITKPFRRKN